MEDRGESHGYGAEEAAVYDAIYQAKKDYDAEAAKLHELILRHKKSPGNALLDMACGTGLHLARLKSLYAVEGVDLSEHQLAIARSRNPDLRFTHGDMFELDLGRRFDIVTCLFSSIGYARNPDRLRQAVAAMAKHLVEGGVLFVEPWILPENFVPGVLHADFVDQPELKVARMNISRVESRIAVVDMHYMVGRPTGIQEFISRHELGLFTHEEYLDSIAHAGLQPVFEPEGLMRRGLYAGIR